MSFTVGQRFEYNGRWEVTATSPDDPPGLDTLVFARNVKRNDDLGKFQAVFWALHQSRSWKVNQHVTHGAQR